MIKINEKALPEKSLNTKTKQDQNSKGKQFSVWKPTKN